jgi:hypothetical protein
VKLHEVEWVGRNGWERGILPHDVGVIYRFRDPEEYTIVSSLTAKVWHNLDGLAAQAIIYHLCNLGTNHGTT